MVWSKRYSRDFKSVNYEIQIHVAGNKYTTDIELYKDPTLFPILTAYNKADKGISIINYGSVIRHVPKQREEWYGSFKFWVMLAGLNIPDDIKKWYVDVIEIVRKHDLLGWKK